jgi:N-acetylmuramoyl-L-alanine amidase
MAIKIFVDMGHNPTNPNAGAQGNGYDEHEITYEVGRRLALLLNANPDFEARTSHNSPTEVLGTSNSSSLRTRVDDANSWGADYFISLHTNASTSPSATGVEGYAYSEGSPGYALGEDIVDALSEITGLNNRGMFVRPGLYVLRRTRMPSVLIEMGYISNPRDAALMGTDPDIFARGIYNGILDYFDL